MSAKATGWVLTTKVGNPIRKLILLTYAEHAHMDGRNAWISVATAAEAAECDKSTASRHVNALVAEGFLRYGDQANIDQRIPERSRPVLYDLAMDEDTRLAWKAAYDPASDPRNAAKALASGGGRKSAEQRAAKRGGLQDPTPSPETQMSGFQGGVAGSNPPGGVAENDRGGCTTATGGVAQVQPEPTTQPTTEPTTTTSAAEASNDADASGSLPGLSAVESDSEPKAPKKRTRISEDWRPSPALMAWTREKHPSVDPNVEGPIFVSHHVAKGDTMASWDAAWRTWMGNADKFATQRRTGYGRGPGNNQHRDTTTDYSHLGF